MPKTAPPDLREKISSVFTRVEDVTYVGLGVLLAVSALFLLLAAAWTLVEGLSFSGLAKDLTVEVVDQILLVLLIIEILSTVQVSFREHVFSYRAILSRRARSPPSGASSSSPQNFPIRLKSSKPVFRNAMFELGLLTVLIFSWSFFLCTFSKKNRAATVERE